MNKLLQLPPDVQVDFKEASDSYVLHIERETYVPKRKFKLRISWSLIVLVFVILGNLNHYHDTDQPPDMNAPSVTENGAVNLPNRKPPVETNVAEVSGFSSLWNESGFLFPYSDEEYLDEQDLSMLMEIEGYTDAELIRFAINEIYARNHYRFKSEALYSFYSQYDWYDGCLSSAEACALFNATEHKNIAFLLQAEEQYK